MFPFKPVLNLQLTCKLVNDFIFISRLKGVNAPFPDIKKLLTCFKDFGGFIRGGVFCSVFIKKINKQCISTIKSYVGTINDGGLVALFLCL